MGLFSPLANRSNVQDLETLQCCVTVLLSSCSWARMTPVKRREVSGLHSYLPQSLSSEYHCFCIFFSTLDSCLSFMVCKKHIQECRGDVQAKMLFRNGPLLSARTCQMSWVTASRLLSTTALLLSPRGWYKVRASATKVHGSLRARWGENIRRNACHSHKCTSVTADLCPQLCLPSLWFGAQRCEMREGCIQTPSLIVRSRQPKRYPLGSGLWANFSWELPYFLK